MKSITAYIAILVLWLGVVAVAAPTTQSSLQIGFNSQGLSSVNYGGQELLADGRIEVRQRLTWPAEANAPTTQPQSGFEPAAARVQQAYAWGTVSCVYRVDGDKLKLDVEVQNTGKVDIRLIDLVLMHLKLPGWTEQGKSEHRWPQPMNVADDLPIVTVNYGSGTMLFCGEEVDRPLGLHVLPDHQADQYAIVLRDEGPPYMGSSIGPGNTRHFLLSLRFGPKDASAIDLARDIHQRFAQRWPMQMKWLDHRPIGYVNLASAEAAGGANPRGWFGDKKNVDTTTDAGVDAFHQRMLKHADICIGYAKDMNAQGVIVWDIEGQEMPHMISYIGDPRMMERMAPEMAAIADAFMKKFTDAGLRIGVTVRPSHVVPSAGGKHPWEHVQPQDPVEEIALKIEYARTRWGCTLFYVDSTVQWVAQSDGTLELKVMPAEFFQILNRRFPDVLLIPEQSTTRTWAYAACYHEVQQGYPSTPAGVRACYPDAFSLIRVVDTPWDLLARRHDEIVAGIRAGDTNFFRTWFNDHKYNDFIKQIHHEAHTR